MGWEYESVLPPGTFESYFTNPYNNKILNVSIVYEHRFAFYYWMKWTSLQAINNPPVLISLDWHQDLVHPSEDEYEELKALNQNDYIKVGIYTAYKLSSLNHCQILAAAYLNLISDIYVLCKQKQDDYENDMFDFIDFLGNKHHVKYFYKIDEILACIKKENIESLYFDVDLDFFTESEDPCGGDTDVELISDEEVDKIIAPHSPLMQVILPKVIGITIALEPEFCGGMRNSNHLFNLLDEALFYPPLLNENSRLR